MTPIYWYKDSELCSSILKSYTFVKTWDCNFYTIILSFTHTTRAKNISAWVILIRMGASVSLKLMNEILRAISRRINCGSHPN